LKETLPYTPSVVMMPDGGFVVGFQRNGDRTTSVWARRFDAEGVPSPEFALNEFTDTGRQLAVRLARLGDGFVAVWQSYAQDGDGDGVFRRAFVEGLVVDSEEAMASESGEGNQYLPAVAGGADHYVVAWHVAPQGIFGLRTRVLTVSDHAESDTAPAEP
jgi:hypothetical protein